MRRRACRSNGASCSNGIPRRSPARCPGLVGLLRHERPNGAPAAPSAAAVPPASPPLVADAAPPAVAVEPAAARVGRRAAPGGRRTDRARRRDAPRGRRRGDGARQGLPDARPPRRPARPARLRADGRPGTRRVAARAVADARAPVADPGLAAPPLRRRRDPARGAAAPAGRLHRLDRVRDRAHLRSRRARVAAAGDRVRALPSATRGRGAAVAPPPPLPGRGVRAVPAAVVPRAEAVLARRARVARADARRDDRARGRGRRPRGRDRDGPPRPAQRPRPHGRPLVPVDPARVRGRAVDRRARRRPRGRHGRRQVPPAGLRDEGHAGRRDRRHDRPQPEPPRGRRPRRRGPRARRADRPLRRRGHPRPLGRAARADPRRRRVPRAGRRRRDAQPAVARGLLDGRDAAPDHEQPGRLHDRPDREPLDPLLERPRQGLRRADRARQRRRPGGGARPPSGSRSPTGRSSATTS